MQLAIVVLALLVPHVTKVRDSSHAVVCNLRFVTDPDYSLPDTVHHLTLRLGDTVEDLRGRKLTADGVKSYLLHAHKEYSPASIDIDLNVETEVTMADLRAFVRRIEAMLPKKSVVNIRVRLVTTKTVIQKKK